MCFVCDIQSHTIFYFRIEYYQGLEAQANADFQRQLMEGGDAPGTDCDCANKVYLRATSREFLLMRILYQMKNKIT